MKKIICFGDSNTYGYDPCSYLGDRYGRLDRWTGIIKEKTGIDVINEGMPGRKIPKSSYEINHSMALLAKECQDDSSLIIMLGSNDLLEPSHPSAENVTNDMKTFLLALLEKEPFSKEEIPITLISPPLMKVGTWTDDYSIIESARIGNCMKMLAEELGLHFLDASTWDLPLCFDGVHMKEEGHHRFAMQVLMDLMGK